MKWGSYSGKAAKLVSKAIGAKSLYVLLALAALILLSGASDKWGK
jgi:hypothetical protein